MVATRDTQQPTGTNICQGHPGAQSAQHLGSLGNTVTLSHCHTVTLANVVPPLLTLIWIILSWWCGGLRMTLVVVAGGGVTDSLCSLLTPRHASPHWDCRVLMGPTHHHNTPRTHQHSPANSGASTSPGITNITESTPVLHLYSYYCASHYKEFMS